MPEYDEDPLPEDNTMMRVREFLADRRWQDDLDSFYGDEWGTNDD